LKYATKLKALYLKQSEFTRKYLKIVQRFLLDGILLVFIM